MEGRFIKKRKDVKSQAIYSRSLLSRKVVLPINVIGKNLDDVIEQYVRSNFEGKCITEGFVRSGSTKIVSYSTGVIERGNNVLFEVIFECDICFPVEGMLIPCVVKSILKAGIRAESATETPSPIVVYVAKDHNFNSPQFNEVKEGDNITVRVIGIRYELNDQSIGVISELYREREKERQPVKQPRITIREDI